MDAPVQGLSTALDPDCGGGAYGVVLDDREVDIGDEASLGDPVAD